MPYRYVSKLEHDTLWLIAFNGVANLALGISFLLLVNTAAESVLDYIFPRNSWAYLWVAVGVIGIAGVWWRSLARFSFLLGGMVIGVFTLASLWAVLVEGQWRAITTTVFLGYIWGLLWGISSLIVERENIINQIQETVHIGEQKLEESREKE